MHLLHLGLPLLHPYMPRGGTAGTPVVLAPLYAPWLGLKGREPTLFFTDGLARSERRDAGEVELGDPCRASGAALSGTGSLVPLSRAGAVLAHDVVPRLAPAMSQFSALPIGLTVG